ncbi:MAG: bifunctional metallophosphatase/5'-nucleotidase [Burkholderiaceae bacterium]|nr:bifunctional metallophosphatase/5'-nucleotidase [Burkholderiaceae bacterium]
MQKTTRGRWRALVWALVGAGVLAGCASPQPPAESYTLTVLHTNDHHSTLQSRSKTLQLHAGGGAPVEVAVDAGGFARVTTAMAELAAASPHVLKLHAGDALTGTLFYNRAGAVGEADAALMNTVCFDAFTLGNHEFDSGDSGLKGFLDLLHQGTCKTPVLSANVHFGPNSALSAAHAPGQVQSSTVLERGGQRIGIVGLTVAQKTKASSSPDPDTTFEDETVAAQREIDRLHAQGINKIIVMAHTGYERDVHMVAQLRGVDVLVGGDSHTLLGPDGLRTHGVGTPAGAYPTRVTDKEGKNVCIVQAWEYAQVVGELQVTFDAQGDVQRCVGTPHVLVGDNFTIQGQPATPAQDAALRASAAASGFLRITAPSAQASAVLAPYQERVAVFSRTLVAVAPEELCARRVPGGPGSSDYSRSSVACNAQGSVGLHGGEIQQIVAQAYLDVAQARYGGADISLQSAGGVRIPLQGQITAAQVIQVLPFGNMLFRLDITADEVKGMLEDGLEAVYGPGGSVGPYPYTGGLRFDVNAAAAKGQRVSAIEVRHPSTGVWGPLESGKLYKLAVLAFNARGGDGYKTLAAVPAARRMDIGVLDTDVFFSYLEQQPKDSATGLPLLRRLPEALYSTKNFKDLP